MKSKLVLSVAVVTLFLCISSPLRAEDTAVLRVVVVQTDNPDAYVKEIEKGRAIMKRLEVTGTTRVWKAKFAGQDAGNIVVLIEYPSLAALAKDEEKTTADPAYRTWLKDLAKMRKIVSDSLYTESKP
jgi:hypothetical protein